MKTLKITPATYQAIADGRKPFDIRCAENCVFRYGEKIKFIEFLGSEYTEQCELYNNGCEVWENINRGDDEDEEYWIDGQEEAIDQCGKDRALCVAYDTLKFTGREITVKIKEVFELDGNLSDYVAFTFEILEIQNKMQPYSLINEY